MGALQENEAGTVYTVAIQGARETQQDAVRVRWLADEGAWLLVLADGMGGHAAGDLASRIAVDSFVASFAARREEKVPLAQALQEALEEANARIAAAQAVRPETAGMGTTLVAAHVSRAGLHWISVGDSPLWIYRGGALIRLNEDHSMRQVASDARRGVSANLLTSALAGTDIHKIDLSTAPVKLGSDDLLLLASDGLLTLDDDAIIGVIAGNPSPEPAGDALTTAVEQAKTAHQDNCTIAVFSPHRTGRSGWRHTGLAVASIIALISVGAAAAYWHYVLRF